MSFLIVVLILRFITKLCFPESSSILSIITRRYGSDALLKFRAFEKNDHKIKKTQLDMNFLSSCKFYGVIPKFLNFKLANSRLHSSLMYTKCRRRLLSVGLANKNKHLKKLQEKHLAFLQELRSTFSWFDCNHLISFANSSNHKSLRRVEFTQNRKLENLKREYLASGINPEKVIFNYSSYSPDEFEKKVLSRGLKFSIYPNKLDYCSFLTPFEKLAIHLKNKPIDKDGVSFDFVKTRLKSIALAAYYGYDSQQLPHNISKAEISALNKLCRNKNIVIIRPDKGNGVVILNRVDYVNKVLTLLGDRFKVVLVVISLLICYAKFALSGFSLTISIHRTDFSFTSHCVLNSLGYRTPDQIRVLSNSI